MTKLKIPQNYRPIVRVTKRNDRKGAFQADYDLPPQNGENRIRARCFIPARNRRQAEFWAARKQQELWECEFSDLDYMKMGTVREFEPADQTLEQFLPIYRELRDLGRSRPLSPRTIDSYEKIIARYFLRPVGVLEKPIGQLRLREIDRALIQDFVAELRREKHPLARSQDGDEPARLSPKSINNITGLLGRILSIAEQRDVIPKRPPVDKLPVEIQEEDTDILSREELRRLFDACYGSYGRLIKLYCLTGLRCMEGAGLMWEDYDEFHVGGQILYVRRQYCPYEKRSNVKNSTGPAFRPPKCGSTRVLPVGPALKAILDEQKALTRLQDGLVFLSEDGNPLCNELIRNAIARTCRRAGIRRVGPQVFRRTYISHLVMSGADPKTIQKLVGHRSLSITMKFYARIEPAHAQAAVRKMEDHLLGPESETEVIANNSKRASGLDTIWTPSPISVTSDKA